MKPPTLALATALRTTGRSVRVLGRKTSALPKSRILGPRSNRDRPIAIRALETIVIKSKSKHPALLNSQSQTDSRVVHSFSQLPLRGDVVAALEGIGLSRPTVIQMLAIPKIARGKNVLCAAETGSGKTLAYLAPLINRLRDEEELCGLIPRLKRPRALILLPSRDLAAQVLTIAKSLCHRARFRAIGLIGGVKRKFIQDSLLHPVDVVVATPNSLLRFQREERVWLSDLSHLVIDEADTLFDSSFEQETTKVIRSLKVRAKKPPPPPSVGEDTQVTIVGATLTGRMLEKIEKLVPNLRKVSTKHVHQILPHIEQRFIKTRQNDKAEKLLKLIQGSSSDVFIVFCNTVPSCDWTARYLRDNEVPVVKLHGGFAPMDRKNLLKEFASGSARVLVSTDIASRGIDSSKVSHVVLFDFPVTLQDYLHRVGRTGRVGTVANKCQATSFMTHRRDVRMAWKIKDAAERQTAVMDSKVLRHLQRTEQQRVSPNKLKNHFDDYEYKHTSVGNNKSRVAS